ncbi:hypothetical protein [uncultured Xanthomonas sp.]|uniref:hypothetical protein n=1 Tax=uncultured Xanthomonas sp. TaxID=152831 RepID=UPI0025E2FCEC|nr:hypothetical protein [uncultured Xanthomonas sp.]
MSASRIRARVLVLLACVAANCSACAVVTVSTAREDVVVRGLFGARVATTGLAPVAIRSRGLGISQTPRAWMLGWHAETAIYVPPDADACRIVLMSNTEAEVRRLLAILQAGGGDLSQLCIASQEVSR